MMFYALVHYLDRPSSLINNFRKNYDPRFLITSPHLTFIFPIDTSIGQDVLKWHISSVLRHWQPFDITLDGIVKSWDNYIFLTVRKGLSEVIKLHDNLYTGVLTSHLRADIEYIPHITIGVISKARSDEALSQANALNIKQDIHLNKLQLIRCKDDNTPHEWEMTFDL